MNIISITNVLVSICALFGYFNYRYIKLPSVIGIMVMAIIFSCFSLLLPSIDMNAATQIKQSLNQINFPELLLHGMLGFLLFAGALHVDLDQLIKYKYTIGFLAVFGTMFSCLMIAFSVYYISSYFGQSIPVLYAFLFGALISPTDPVAVMAILKKAGVPKSLESKVVGESLFNDGIAVVIFVSLITILSHGNISLATIGFLFIKEVLGGMILGWILGQLTLRMLMSIDSYQIEIMLTLALVMGGYELAYFCHLSAPITIVVAGLIIGRHGSKAMTPRTRENMFNFWELVDEILNAILFLLIGLELMLVNYNSIAIYVGLIMIPLILFVRYFSVKHLYTQ